jgi:hypothetical protein
MLVTDRVQAALTALLAVVAASSQADLWELLPIGLDSLSFVISALSLAGVLGPAHLGAGRRSAIRAVWLFLVASVFLAIVPYLGGPIGADLSAPASPCSSSPP